MSRLKALLIDAHGTLVTLEPPAVALRAIVRERFGVDVGEERAGAAIKAEIAYYRGHLADGRDAVSLARLRARCATVLMAALELGDALAGVSAAAASEAATAVLLDSLVFRAYDDALPALADARARGLRIVVVSNWDVSLPETLARIGLLDAVDAVVSSAAFGAAKPDPAIFAAALRIAGAGAGDAIHVGDNVEEDIAGARAAGVRPILLIRGEDPAPPGVHSLRSLLELPAALDAFAGQTVLG